MGEIDMYYYICIKHMRRILLFLQFLIMLNNSSAQDMHLVDSLNVKLDASKADSTRVMILFDLSETYKFSDSAKAVSYANQCRGLSEKIGYKAGVGYYYQLLGNLQLLFGNFNDGINCFGNALKIFEEAKDKRGIAYAKNGIGSTYILQAKFDSGLQLNQEALKICEEIGDKQSIANIYNDKGNLHHQKGNYSEALKNYYASLKIYEGLGNQAMAALVMENIANSYNKAGNNREARSYTKQAYAINKRLRHLWSRLHF